MENYVLHKAASRGIADHGWLKSYHTFSFGSYHDPNKVHFGALRVLNDDTVSGGMGFGKHPHDNMEIISIPLEGELLHKDSMGNQTVIKEGEIQVMSAGKGIYHSEQNNGHDKPVKFLQIWVIPNKRNVAPRYGQQAIDLQVKNAFQQILSPDVNDAGVWIYQDAWFSMGSFDKATTTTYTVHKKSNGVYAFVLAGSATINGHEVSTRDGLGVWDTGKLDIKANAGAHMLLIEVPMQLQ